MLLGKLAEYKTRLALALIIGLALPSFLPIPAQAQSPVIDLVIGGEGATSWNISDIKPSDSGSKIVELHNAGSKAGFLTIWINDIVSSEGTNPESETGNVAEPGELGEYLLFNISCSKLVTGITLPAKLQNLPQSASGPSFLRIDRLNAGETISLEWQWELPSQTGNDVQGDTLSFTINYYLEELQGSGGGDGDDGTPPTPTPTPTPEPTPTPTPPSVGPNDPNPPESTTLPGPINTSSSTSATENLKRTGIYFPVLRISRSQMYWVVVGFILLILLLFVGSAKKRTRRLLIRLTLVITTLVVAIAFSLTFVAVEEIDATYRAEFQRRANSLLDTLSLASASSMYFGDNSSLNNLMEAFRKQPETILSATLYDADNRLIIGTSSRETGDLSLDSFSNSVDTVFGWTDDSLTAGRAIIAGNDKLGAIKIVLSAEAMQADESAARGRGVIAAIIAIALGAFFAFRISRSVAKPLGKVGHAMQSISLGQLDRRIDEQGWDEIASLSKSFNAMTSSLQDMMARRSAILGSTLEGVLTIDTDGNILELNPSAEKLFGWNCEQAIGTSFIASVGIAHEDFAREVANHIARSESTLINQGMETTAKNEHGEEFPIELSISRILIDKPVMFAVIVRDISQRKKAETYLRMQKELIDRILKTIPSAVLVIGRDLKVDLCNPAFYEIFGMHEDEVQGKNIHEIFDQEDLLAGTSRIQAGTERFLQRSFRFKVDGQEKMLVADIISMGQGEVLVIINDVTEEMARQEKLYLTDRLVTVAEMAAGAAHEMNNPLTSILGLSQLLMEEELPNEMREDVTTIHGQAQRATGIIKGLLSFARKHDSSRHPTQINSLIEEVINLRAYELKIHNIKVEYQLSPGLPEVTVDYFQMQQVFLNIILNAEQAMTEAHHGGILKVTSDKVDGVVRVSFTDDGPGISPANMRKLFSPFFTTKEVGKGTGLGLSICYGIVTAHNGQIYAQSEAGHGATFIVELPIEPAEATEAERG